MLTAEGLSALVNIGSAGAVVAVVIIFLNFIKETRKADGVATERLAGVIDRLAARVESLEGKFDTHDAKEMEFIRSMTDKPTQPRRAKQ